MTRTPHGPRSTTPALSAALALWLLAAPALAQYKVVWPDGSVTYTDRPPVTSNARITVLGQPRAAVVAPETALPFDLRQVATRFPVTLYTSPDCTPCENGRRLLQQRGVPFAERRVTSEDDAAALERAVGGRTVPALTVGSQALRGLSQGDWTAYLDAAGYPRESRLPPNYQPPPARALVERADPAVPPAPPVPPAQVVAPAPAETPPAETPAAEPPIKF